MTEEALLEYLERRGISQTKLQEMQNEKIMMSTILIMDDDELKKFISKLGDRIDVKNFCKRRLALKKNSLIESLRIKINKKRDSERSTGEQSQPSCSFRKTTRTVEVGWMHFEEDVKRYIQLKAKSGGGTRKIIVGRNSDCSVVLEEAKEKFFPEGISTKGPLKNFEFKLLDFKKFEIDPKLTVQYLFDSTGFTKLKFYLGTKNIEHGISDICELEKTETSLAAHDNVHIDNSDEFDVPFQENPSFVHDNAHMYNLEEFEEPFQSSEISSQAVQNAISQELHPISERLTLNSNDDFFLPDGEIELDIIPRVSADAPVINVYINRQDCVSEMLHLYEDLSIMEKQLHVEFLGEQGLDLGGLSRELFSIFWKDVETKFFIGEDIVVPFIPLHIKKEKEKFIVIGRILAHMMLLTGTIPIKLSRCIYLSFGNSNISNETVLEDFLLFLSEVERKLIKKALHEFTSLTPSELETITNIFISYNYMTNPRETQFKEQIHDVATEVLVERPQFLVKLMKQGFPCNLLKFWNNINEHGLTFILNQQRPTVDKVLNCLKTEEILTNEQTREFHFLKMYVQELSSESLLHFLCFVTGSVVMPHEIKVSFNSLSAQERRPIAHTCSNIIELSYMYDSYQEFKKEFNIYLNSEFTFQYTQV